MPARIPLLTSTLSMRLTPDERRNIESRARAENRTVSNYIRMWIQELLKERAR